MEQPVIYLSELKPLERLRLRTRGAYEGTITAPGALVSDGKVIFDLAHVPEAVRALAERLAGQTEPALEGAVDQARAGARLREIAAGATRKARVLGQVRTPEEVQAQAPGTDHVAVLRYGRGRNTGYVLANAHRLRLLQTLLETDEIRCTSPQEPLLLCRGGRPAGGLTVLHVGASVA